VHKLYLSRLDIRGRESYLKEPYMNENMNNNNVIPRLEVGNKIEGFFKVGRVDPDGTVTWQTDEWQRNLMLNTGMNMIGKSGGDPGIRYARLMWTATAGTGSRVNKFDSGGSEVSQSGNLIGLSGIGTITDWTASADGGNYTHMLNDGDVVKFADGTEAFVTHVDDATTATVNTSATVVSQTFIIYKTSQTSLHGPRVSATSVVSGGNGNTRIKNTTTLWRTNDFAAESATKIYTEVGWVTQTSIQANRCLLDTPITIPVGSQLRLAMAMAISIYPSASVYYPNDMIDGWVGSSGTASVQRMLFEYWENLGDIATIPDNRCFPSEPRETAMHGWISSNTGAVGEPLLTGATPINRGLPYSYGGAGDGVGTTNVTYIADTFYHARTASFTVAQGSSSAIRSFGFGTNEQYNDPRNAGLCWAFLMNNSQSKDHTQTLQFYWRASWSRVLA